MDQSDSMSLTEYTSPIHRSMFFEPEGRSPSRAVHLRLRATRARAETLPLSAETSGPFFMSLQGGFSALAAPSLRASGVFGSEAPGDESNGSGFECRLRFATSLWSSEITWQYRDADCLFCLLGITTPDDALGTILRLLPAAEAREQIEGFRSAWRWRDLKFCFVTGFLQNRQYLNLTPAERHPRCEQRRCWPWVAFS